MAERGLASYEDWRHCIVELCKITPTPNYVAARIAELTDERNSATQKFVESWGDSHRVQVIAWFERLGQELKAAPTA
ncbi:MAG: hypothetical protein AAF580_15995 [Pseudomonadota bacterium]